MPGERRHFEQAPGVDRPPLAIRYANICSLPATQGQRSKDRSSNLIYSNFRRFFVILTENLYPTAPRPLFSCIDHTITSRLILSLHRKGQET
jgi:hypothetical protein